MLAKKEAACNCDSKYAYFVFIVFADIVDSPVEISIIMEEGALEISVKILGMLRRL